MSSISKCQNLKQDRDKVVALIMAAGSGCRFGCEIAKQFCTIDGVVPIKETVRLFLSLDFISGVICVIPESHRRTYIDLRKLFRNFIRYRQKMYVIKAF